MGKLINDFLSKPIPPEVWHYTNLAGFEGILSSGRIWATEAHHTTDETEFVHARDVGSRYLERMHHKDESMAEQSRRLRTFWPEHSMTGRLRHLELRYSSRHFAKRMT